MMAKTLTLLTLFTFIACEKDIDYTDPNVAGTDYRFHFSAPIQLREYNDNIVNESCTVGQPITYSFELVTTIKDTTTGITREDRTTEIDSIKLSSTNRLNLIYGKYVQAGNIIVNVSIKSISLYTEWEGRDFLKEITFSSSTLFTQAMGYADLFLKYGLDHEVSISGWNGERTVYRDLILRNPIILLEQVDGLQGKTSANAIVNAKSIKDYHISNTSNNQSSKSTRE